MNIVLNKVHYPVTTLGYGKRIGIWLQGCSIHCKGCVSRDTWAPAGGSKIAVAKLVESMGDWFPGADGITISGGEPFDQPRPLRGLLRLLRNKTRGDILVYSGYSKKRLQRLFPDILEHVDVLISEPYREKAGNELVWRGSDNQIVTLLSELARKRYPGNINGRKWPSGKRLEMVLGNDEIWMVGIPRRGELANLKNRLTGRGLDVSMSSDETKGKS